jgi:hypothetical protein
MKNIKNLTLLLLAIYVSSCSDDFLSPEPISAISADTYYSNEAELETGVNNMYDGLQGINDTQSNSNHGTQIEYQVTEMRSDNTKTKSSEGEPAQFESFSVQSTNGIVFDYYRSTYNVIFRANTVLENLDVASAEAAAQFEGEAKFVRAYCYFNLVRLYGPVPFVDKVITPADKETQFTRVDESTIYTLILGDLQTAVANLDNSNTNRASKAAAQALLAKVHLTLGNYAEAQGLCESVIGTGLFSLQDNFKDVFYNERNSEIIFAIEYRADDEGDSQNFSAEWLNAVGRSSGLNYVTDEAKAALDAMGGNRTLYSYRVDAKQPNFNQVIKYLPDGDDALGIAPTSGDPTLAGNDWIVLRYADVLLMHVEAVMGGGDGTSGTSALASFNEVRRRAGLDEVSSISKQELLDERRVELAFENQRLFDLIRFGVAQEVLGQFAADNGFSFSTTDLLLPIPQAEIGISAGLLTQNPGY